MGMWQSVFHKTAEKRSLSTRSENCSQSEKGFSDSNSFGGQNALHSPSNSALGNRVSGSARGVFTGNDRSWR
jgi:hypothetical protein